MSLDEYRFGLDAPANTSTTYYLLDDFFAEGTISSVGERDWYRLETDIGASYGVVVAEGSPFSTLAADGVYLILRNRFGTLLSISNTAITPPDESLIFSATDTLYYVEVVGVLTGDYSLISFNLNASDDFFGPITAVSGVTLNARLDYTADQETYISQLSAGRRYFGVAWSADIGDLFVDIENPFGGSVPYSLAGDGSAYVFTPTVSGVYLTSVSSDSFRDTGSFSFLTGQTLTLLPMWVGTPGADAYAASAAAEFWGWDGNDTATGSAGDDMLVGGSGADDLSGEAGSDTIDGGDGADILRGGSGSNSLIGGAGDDLYDLNVRDAVFGRPRESIVVEEAGGGIDTVLSGANHSLAPEVEALVLTGFFSVAGIGNSLANGIIGNVGNNSLEGGLGNDTIWGGFGIDTLVGGGGTDSLVGGDDDDLYIIDAADQLIEAADGGADTVQTAGSHTLRPGFETLVLTGALDTSGVGNTLANTMLGNGGRNRLTGGGGNDTLVGGLGADTLTGGLGTDSLVGGGGDDLYVADVLDRIVELADGGSDTVQAAGNIVLAAQVEHLVQTGALNAAGTGNALANAMLGNSGNNLLAGAQGNDTLGGGAGNDTLLGGLGIDRLVGGGGGDVFRYDLAAQGLDIIADFVAAEDQLLVRASGFGGGLAAGVDLGATGRFVQNGTGAAASAAGTGQFVFNSTNGQLLWDADGTGGTAAVRVATLTGVGPGGVTASDITVIA